MIKPTRTRTTSPDTGVGVGLVVASAFVPRTFARSLSSRSAVDQGIVTGLATGLQYLLTVGTQDTLQAVAAEVVDARSPRRLVDRASRQRRLTLLADLAVIPLGFALQRAVRPRPGESLARGAVRQAGWRFMVTGVGGALLLGAQAGAREVDARLGGGRRVQSFPLAVPVGLGVAYVLSRRDGTDAGPQGAGDGVPPSSLRSLGVAGGVVGGLAGVAYGEHALASLAGRGLASVLPGGPQLWKLTGHGAALGLLAGSAYLLYGRAIRKIEAGTSALVPVVESDEASRWTGPTVSGGPESLVPWATLGREGRRHALTPVRPRTWADRPPGTPDLSIETVMSEPARATPVQVYVGLDSAPTARERVDLALAEMERVKAFDRSLIMLVSPTGTGYVNYVATAAVQYLTRGDVATVTMQYSKRPSPLSLGKIDDAREQNRLLWMRILMRLRESPEPRPRVVLFGESLGAHTSQDVFLHWGTIGPEALGIDRALWIGTPYGSGWMREVTSPGRLDVDRDRVVMVNDYDQFRRLDADRRSRARYVLVSHDNDGVTKFGPDLLLRRPAWLDGNRPQPEESAAGSPRGIPSAMQWRPITTFFQSLIDMKNAQVPGAYRAWAHDYRPDVARFMSDVFELPVSPAQLAAVEAALEQREHFRQDLFEPSPQASSS
jgi:uncharacterized membrane protein